MSTGTPVVVSRIQNRRGLQVDFDNLYPSGQPGTGTNVLQPGELALCTDTGRVFVGTVNLASEKGYYIELAVTSTSSNISFLPVRVVLPPTGIAWSSIPLLTVAPTPFYSILYSITDVTASGPTPAAANMVGISFSKNGKLEITAIVEPVVQPPFPVTLTDTGTEINISPDVPNPWPGLPATVQPDINFRADYDVDGNIQISYMHDFPVALTFSTSSIIWVSL
jgi:hypothetical protein